MKQAVLYIALLLFQLNSIGQTASIRGKVMSLENNQVLANSIVELQKNNKTIDVVYSSKNGNYFFENLEKGVYSIKIKYLGFSTMIDSNIALSEGRLMQLNFKLNPRHITLAKITVRYQRPFYQIRTGCPGPRRIRNIDLLRIISVQRKPNTFSYDLPSLENIIGQKSGIVKTTQSAETYDGMGATVLWSSNYFSGGGIMQGQPVDLFIE